MILCSSNTYTCSAYTCSPNILFTQTTPFHLYIRQILLLLLYLITIIYSYISLITYFIITCMIIYLGFSIIPVYLQRKNLFFFLYFFFMLNDVHILHTGVGSFAVIHSKEVFVINLFLRNSF